MIDTLSDKQVKVLELKAEKIRELIIKMLLTAGSGHSAGSLDMADIFSAFYFHILNHKPKKPDWENRDRLVLSNGHICPVQYATLALAGYFPVKELQTLRQINSRLQGHPHRIALPGLETSSGPLGEGISQAIGIALAARMDKKKFQTYCLCGDGEMGEGNIWEALLFAGKEKMYNVTLIIDRNNIQIDGFTEQVLPLEPLHGKLEAFGWHVLEIDGHNMREIVDTLHSVRTIFEKPVAIIAHTIAGKGVDFMEHDFHWHGRVPNIAEGKKALKELRTLRGMISQE